MWFRRLFRTLFLGFIPWSVLAGKCFPFYVAVYSIPLVVIGVGAVTRWILYDGSLWFVVAAILIWAVSGFLSNIFYLRFPPRTIKEAVGSLVVFLFIVLTVTWIVKERHLVVGIDIVIVKSISMEPALCEGDWIVLDTWVSEQQLVNGDIVTFVDPQWGMFELIKRIVASPGEFVRFSYNDFNVVELLNSPADMASYQQVNQGHYFVMGDNILNSRDSRAFGAIGQEEITGVMKYKLIEGC